MKSSLPSHSPPLSSQRLFPARFRGWLRDLLVCGLIMAGVAALAVHGALHSGYTWQWERVRPYFFTLSDQGLHLGPLVSLGLTSTLRIGFFGLLLALSLGLITASLRLAGGPLARGICLGYVQTVRNTPLMVQFLAAYALIPAAWGLTAEHIAVLTLGLFEGAYMAEIFRAGFLAVPEGQWEAARSLGLPPYICWTRVALPQAFRHCLPPLLSQCVSLIKDSSLASVIAVGELAQRSGLVVSDTFLSFEVWLPVAGIYLALALALSALAMLAQRHFARGAPAARLS